MINSTMNLAVDGSASPDVVVWPGPFTLKQIDFILSCGGEPEQKKYGSLDFLANGVKGGIYKLDDTPVHEFFKGMTCRCNIHLWYTKFDITLGPDGFTGIRKLEYEIAADEKLMFTIADDLTGLDAHTIHILGDD